MKKREKAIKSLKTYFSKNQQTVTILLFVALFAFIGVATLLRSKAAIGNDLVVTSITMSPTAPAAGQAVTFSAVVKNQGTTAVPSGTAVGVAFYVDNVKVASSAANTAGLAVNGTVTLAASSTWAATAGPHSLRAVADDNNAIPDEANEGNNAFSSTFSVGNTGTMAITPSTTTVNVNNNFTVAINITTPTSVTTDAVDATITYDSTKFSFVSIDATGSAYTSELGTPQTTPAGTLKISRAYIGSDGVSGTNLLVANVTFKALAGTGTGTLQLSGNATRTGTGAFLNPTFTNGTVTFQTPDTTAPTATINTPANNSNAFQTITVTATATDNVGVTKTELWVDGQLVGAPDTTSPYSFTLDTTKYANGAHTVQLKAYDAANLVGTSPSVTINVRNWDEDINQDGVVNIQDFSLLNGKFGQTGTTLGRADINKDGIVNIQDFSLLNGKFGL